MRSYLLKLVKKTKKKTTTAKTYSDLNQSISYPAEVSSCVGSHQRVSNTPNHGRQPGQCLLDAPVQV